ncbi:hypothetical protein B0H14DRAFT_193607 [Mycena olivaceomarginata]|nr:hypothetical protein B0H14DRAFT_193607 [Mycena olivaceomarginata]
MAASFGRTLSSGIQDISAILPLLGTEQCEMHIGSGLRGGGNGGFLYAAITTISIFGSLGAAKAAFKIMLASVPSFGARILQQMGFDLSGAAVEMLSLKDGRYVAETRLLDCLAKHHVRDTRLLFVRQSDVIPRFLDRILPLHPWNIRLLLCSLLVAILGLAPYFHFFAQHQTLVPRVELLFPLLRVMGGTLCVFPSQIILQRRILAILRQRILFKCINDLVEEKDGLKIPVIPGNKWSHSLTSEDALFSLTKFIETTGPEQMPFIMLVAEAIETDPSSDPGEIAKKLKDQITEPWSSTFLRLSMLFGFLMTLAGYLGCFSLVQDSGSTAADTYTWLAVEAALSFIRMIVWGWNPEWDDPQGVTLDLNKKYPLPTFVPDAGTDNQEVDIIPEAQFWQDLTAYCGPLNMDNLERIPDFALWYAWIKDEGDATDRLCLVLKGKKTYLCLMEKHQNEHTDITLYDPQIIGEYAVRWPFKNALPTSHHLVGNMTFRMALFRHYSFIISSKLTSSFHIRTSWTLLESGVERSGPNPPNSAPRDVEVGQQETTTIYQEAWLALEAAVKVLLTGTPQTSVQVDSWFMLVFLFSLKHGNLGDQFLYDRLKKYLEGSEVVPNIAEALSKTTDGDLLESYDDKWKKYSQGTLQLDHVFASINRGWMRRQREKDNPSFDTGPVSVEMLENRCIRLKETFSEAHHSTGGAREAQEWTA